MERALSDQSLRPTSQNVAYWVGWGLSGLAIAFCLMDAIMKLLALSFVLEASDRIGFQGETLIRELGVILLGCTILYAIPATAVLGAVLLTGYLGGAVASHLRLGDPLFTHVLSGVYGGLLVWGGLYLRDPRVRAIFPWARMA
jgi:DoxX-like protein